MGAMRSTKGVMAVVLMAAGCGGASTKAPGHEMSSDGGAPNMAGAANGGAAHVPQPANLGDGDHSGEGQPRLPTDVMGGFLWNGCAETGWRIGNWFVTFRSSARRVPSTNRAAA